MRKILKMIIQRQAQYVRLETKMGNLLSPGRIIRDVKCGYNKRGARVKTNQGHPCYEGVPFGKGSGEAGAGLGAG